jgi:hypothetical protein
MDNLCSNQVNLTNNRNIKRLIIIPLYKVNKYSNRDNILIHRCWGHQICRSRIINGMYLRIVQRQAHMELQTFRSHTISGRYQHQHRPDSSTINISTMYRDRLQVSNHNGSTELTKPKFQKIHLRDNSMLLPKDNTYKLLGHSLERTLHLQTFLPSLVHKVSLFRPSTAVRA